MSTQQVLQIAGAAIGFAVGGLAGARTGFMLGSLAGAFVPIDGPDPGDLGAPEIAAGSAMWRGYGSPKRAGSPIWMSDFHAVESGGKGSEPPSLSFTVDVIYLVYHGTNFEALLRAWANKKLEYSALAVSSPGTIAASLATTAWSAIEFCDGNPAQMPWSVHEDAEGVGNVSAHRGLTTVRITGLNCGGSKALPLVEFELAQAVTTSSLPVVLFVHYGAVFPERMLPDTVLTVSVPLTPTITVSRITFQFDIGDLDLRGDDAATIILSVGGVDWFAFCCAREFGIDASRSPWVKFPGSVFASTGSGAVTEGGTYTVDFAIDPVTTNWTFTIVSGGGTHYSQGGSGLTPTVMDLLRMQDDPGIGSVETAFSNIQIYGPSEVFTPLPVTLASIIQAEQALNPDIDPADHDVSLCVAIDVDEYQCRGNPADALANICNMYYVDLVPNNPLRWVPRGQAVVKTLTNAEVGAPGKPFTGLKEDNDDEQPAIAGLQFPNRLDNHNPGFVQADRLATPSANAKNLATLVGFTPTAAKGRAITYNLLRSAARFTAQTQWSDRRSTLQPGDAILLPDENGNLFDVLIRASTYDGTLHKASLELNDASALVYAGVASTDDHNAITVTPPVDLEAVYIDGPILREADNDAGAYSAVRVDAAGTFPTGEIRRSTDDVDFSLTVASHSTAATIGQVSAALPATARRGRWDEYSTLTIDLGSTGQTLASSTRAAMQADRSINLGVVGGHGRWQYFRWRTATLDSPGVYTLSGLLLGLYGTESHIATGANGDDFVVASTAWRRLPGEVVDIGSVRYMKAVAAGQLVSAATSEVFTNEAVGRLPYAPTRLEAARDGSNNITFAWGRRTRAPVRYGGAGGTYAPVFEDTEAYEVDIYSSGTYTTVLRTISASSTGATYSAAQQTTDGLTPGAVVYARVYQLSAQVGRGNYLQAAA